MGQTKLKFFFQQKIYIYIYLFLSVWVLFCKELITSFILRFNICYSIASFFESISLLVTINIKCVPFSLLVLLLCFAYPCCLFFWIPLEKLNYIEILIAV